MSGPNAELAYKVLDHIDAHPEQWRQDFYVGETDCGTAACFAGWACLLSGEVPLYEDWEPYDTDMRRTDAVLGDRSVSWRAQELLGASRFEDHDEDDGRDLFSEWNTREDLGSIVEAIFGPRPDGPS